MTTQLTTKLAALGVALLVNSAIIGGVVGILSANLRVSALSAVPARAASVASLMPTI